MARPVKFNTEQLLDKAMYVFWQQGYEATSVQDLGKAMDLHPGSIYNTFGDKHSLFIAVLDRYIETMGSLLIDILRQPKAGRNAIEAVFNTSLKMLTSEAGRRGCLMTNAAMECGDMDAGVISRVSAYQRTMEAALGDCLVQAQAVGDIRPISPEELQTLARFLNGCLQGMRVLAHSGPEARLRLEAIAQIAVQTMD